mgnify:CR=1 FL=1
MNFARLIAEVRPHRVLSFKEAEATLPSSEYLLVHGTAPEAIEVFERVAPRLEYGSAVLFFGACVPELESRDRVWEIANASDFRPWFPPGLPEGGRAFVKSWYDGDTDGSHWPHLAEAVRRTTGPVLEMGSGASSTPRLHALLLGSDRRLVTVDNQHAWADKFRYLATDWHAIEVHANPAQSPRLDEMWGVVFVDHAPGETRGRAVDRARDQAEYIVVHDTEERGYGLESLLDTFRHRKDFRRARPWTTVLSETREIW